MSTWAAYRSYDVPKALNDTLTGDTQGFYGPYVWKETEQVSYGVDLAGGPAGPIQQRARELFERTGQ